MTPERDTWDVKLVRAIRRTFGVGFGGRAQDDRIEAWERAKMEAWDREEEAARQRSSEEMHEELRHSSSGEQGP
jgi:hypothetical protein